MFSLLRIYWWVSLPHISLISPESLDARNINLYRDFVFSLALFVSFIWCFLKLLSWRRQWTIKQFTGFEMVCSVVKCILRYFFCFLIIPKTWHRLLELLRGISHTVSIFFPQENVSSSSYFCTGTGRLEHRILICEGWDYYSAAFSTSPCHSLSICINLQWIVCSFFLSSCLGSGEFKSSSVVICLYSPE